MIRALLSDFHRRWMSDAAVRLWRRRLYRRGRTITIMLGDEYEVRRIRRGRK